ncbi:MAG TPA: glycosyltransferase [Chloroflexia bacterium]|nr:glycosyltransferase [Chloroflexia bacterium]
MKVLFTHQLGSGHWHPLVPLARTLEAAGHEVAFASLPGVGPTIESNDFRFFPVGRDDSAEEVQQRKKRETTLSAEEQADFTQKHVFAGIRAERSLPDLLKVITSWHPNLMISENTEYAGCIAAECAGIPHATVQITAFRPHVIELVAAPLDKLRASVGLPTSHPSEFLFRYLLLTPRPPILRNPDAPMPPTTHAFRYVGFNQSGEERLPDWVAHLGQRPTVFASLGTVFNHLTRILSSILEGLRDEPINLILAVGRNTDPLTFGEQPPNVHIERYIPQSLLLPYCDLVVTQGGSGTTMDALSHGLPMVMIPIAADQPQNARRCTELGIARMIEPGQQVGLAETIRDAVREVLSDPHYKQNAQNLQKEIEGLPGLEYPVALLERLAVERLPIVSRS